MPRHTKKSNTDSITVKGWITPAAPRLIFIAWPKRDAKAVADFVNWHPYKKFTITLAAIKRK